MRIEQRDGKLAIVDFDDLEAYKIACKIEKDGIDFYNRLRNKTVDRNTKDAMSFLLGEEKDHLRFFQGCLYDLREKKEDLSEEEDLLSSMDYGIFQPYQSMEEVENILSDSKKAIKLGLIIEDKSIKFYSTCKDNISSQDVKKEISKIIEEEYKHKQLLENILK